MVVFTCNHCGDSLRKPTVEKHYAFACRRAKSLTCVDCLKDFREEEYVAHTKCVSEEERYAAKGSMPLGIVKKGELKQESWVDMIRSIIDKEPNLKPSQKNLLEIISDHSNIPRKKPKFLNFIRSSSGGRVNMKDVEDVWNIIEKYKNDKSQNANNMQNSQSLDISNKRKANDAVEVEPAKKKKKKKDNSDIENEKNDHLTEVNPAELSEPIKFDFNAKILFVLQSKGTVSLKKLQKKVINAYLKHTGASEAEATPKTLKKFNKKLKKLSNIHIVDDIVSIKQT